MSDLMKWAASGVGVFWLIGLASVPISNRLAMIFMGLTTASAAVLFLAFIWGW